MTFIAFDPPVERMDPDQLDLFVPAVEKSNLQQENEFTESQIINARNLHRASLNLVKKSLRRNDDETAE